MVYDIISNDQKLIDMYIEIDKKFSDTMWVYHGLTHINNVVKITEIISKQLEYDNELIDAIKTAAFLHDLGCIYGKDLHELNGYKIVKKYFEENDINFKYKNDVLLAIKYHRNNIRLENPIAPILRFADKIDTTKERVTPYGMEIKGMRQYQYIDKIEVLIDEKLKVNFIVNSKANKVELENYYFTKKTFEAVKSFANYLGKSYKITYNDNRWEIKKSDTST